MKDVKPNYELAAASIGVFLLVMRDYYADADILRMLKRNKLQQILTIFANVPRLHK